VKLKAHFNLHRYHDFSFVLENNYAIAKANEYRNAKAEQNFLSFITSYTYRSKNDKLYANILFRQQLNNRVLAPFVFDAAATYQFHKSVTLQVKAARLFKVPTLNDLYWVPGGQSELLPEKGWSGEWMMQNSLTKNHFYFSNSLSNFYYWVNDWIVWLPTRQGYWAPQNVKKVFSRGLQEDISLRYTLRKFVMNVYAGYQFNISTQLSSHQVNDVANKKQLIYEPLHKVYTSISTSYAGFLLQYTHQYTGKRYTSTDHKNALAAFQTADVLLTKTMRCKEFEFMLSLGIDNLFNSRYYMVESRPMPRRNYKVGIIIKCQHELKP
jgi:iron complex outermembrane receptor protein